MTGVFQFGTVMLSFQEPGFRFTQSGVYTLLMLTNTVANHKPPGDLYVVQQVDLDTYKEDGAVLLNSVFDESWIDELRQSADRALSQSENYFHRQRVWENDKICREYCLNSAAVSLAAAFLESAKVNLLYDQVFSKSAGDPATPWHNDLPYWPVRNGSALTIWLALDPINFDSGSLEFIAGSHSWDKLYQPFTTVSDGSVERPYKGTEDAFEPLPNFDAERDQHRILCWEIEPGDVLIFDSMIVHGARANSSPAVRRGYAVRYTGDGMTYYSAGEINKIITNSHLQDGQVLDSDQYPVIHLAI